MIRDLNQTRSSHRRIALMAAVFVGSLLAGAVGCTSIWGELVTDQLYHCTDPVGFDFLAGPADRVHGRVAGQLGELGDTIEPGWTLGGLKRLWAAFIAVLAGFNFTSTVVAWRWLSKPCLRCEVEGHP